MQETVLILDAQAVQTLIVSKSLKKSGYEVLVLCNDKNNYGYHTRYASGRFVGPSSHDIDKYHQFLIYFLAERKVDVLIPMTDDSAKYVSIYKKELQTRSNVLMPDFDVFLRGYDKNQLMTLCLKKGYPHPFTIDLSEANCDNNGSLKSFPYPGLLKPNFTTGGRGMTLIDNYESLRRIYPLIKVQYGECHLQQFIQAAGMQVKVELFVDENQRLKYSSVIHKQRYYPVNGGSSCCNVTINHQEAVKICASVLKDIAWVGFADFDLIEDPNTGELLIMELNPRIPACVKSAFKSGIDYATIIADATLGKSLKHYNYVPGKSLRHLGFEILWFIKSSDRFRTEPSWFKFFDKNVYYQDISWNDIIPFIFGTWGNLKKQLNREFRKSKSKVKL